jgi:hypothetical protein
MRELLSRISRGALHAGYNQWSGYSVRRKDFPLRGATK